MRARLSAPPGWAEDRTAGRGRRTEDRPGHRAHQVRPGHQDRRAHQALLDRGRRDPAVRQDLLGLRVREEHRGLQGRRRGHPDRPACRALAAAPAGGLEVETPEGQADVEEW
ncbi:hypothetical protein AVL48_09010 [Amycolatopsis regifaucium]|uniref:Uncharacterized protein n=1 Tax=Amycolatopsis regifaucium TaxID=546365 RepID=A0A154MC41_9PSEU|nr:hypothetical protein AVL48_09010 [Amycolatopsis regifaucium]